MEEFFRFCVEYNVSVIPAQKGSGQHSILIGELTCFIFAKTMVFFCICQGLCLNSRIPLKEWLFCMALIIPLQYSHLNCRYGLIRWMAFLWTCGVLQTDSTYTLECESECGHVSCSLMCWEHRLLCRGKALFCCNMPLSESISLPLLIPRKQHSKPQTKSVNKCKKRKNKKDGGKERGKIEFKKSSCNKCQWSKRKSKHLREWGKTESKRGSLVQFWLSLSFEKGLHMREGYTQLCLLEAYCWGGFQRKKASAGSNKVRMDAQATITHRL